MVISSIVKSVSALDVIRQMHRTEDRLGTNIERLSTGLRINSAADNPGDMVTLNQLRTRIKGVDQASLNAQTVVNMAATASSALADIMDLVQSIRTKAVAAANTGSSESITRAGYQSEIQDMLDEMDRIVSTTTFNGKTLLDGSYGSTTRLEEPNLFPGSVAFGPDASTLREGTSLLNIVQTNSGSERFSTGDTGGMNLGIRNRTDVAVSIGQFIDEGAGAVAGAGDNLRDLNFAGVSLHGDGVIQFSGVIVDGSTSFRGELTVAGPPGGNSINDLVTSIQSAIDTAESSIGVNDGGTGPYETIVSYDNTTGRLKFTNAEGNTHSQFSIDFTINDDTGATQTTSGSTRAGDIYNPQVIATDTSGAVIGNSLTAITGSTFDTGTFEITVSSVTSAQQRTVETTYAFTDGGGTAVLSTTSLATSVLFNGTTTLSLSVGDTIDFTGTNPDGTTFSGTIDIVAGDAGVGQGDAETFQDLIDELNHRDQTSAFYGWNDATATLSSGKIQLVDDVADTSSTAFQMTVNASGTAVDDGTVVYTGNPEQATISIAGGESQSVEAGEIVTLEGTDSTVEGRTYQVTFRVGDTLFDGSDDLVIAAQEYTATLNGGNAVTFRNGDQGVFVTDGVTPTGNIKGAQQLKVDFNNVIGIDSDGRTFSVTTTENRVNYHIGPDREDGRKFAYFDVRTSNLGSSSGSTLEDINVSTLTGAENAIDVIDDAVKQLNLVEAIVGSLESRMGYTSSDLDLYSLELQGAESTIGDADIAKETTELTMNYVLLNSQTATLVQTMLIPKTVFPLLSGHDLP